MKKIIIIGATSGIGKEIAERYAAQGHQVGITGRRIELLEEIRQKFPENIYIQEMDVCEEPAVQQLQSLIETMGGIDTLFINAGYGKEIGKILDSAVELQTVKTNVWGFTNLIIAGYNYFKTQPSGHIIVTSSVANVRGLRQAPSYSAGKRYMRQYVDCLAQKARHEKLNIAFTTLMPGFIETGFLAGSKYPLIISLPKAADLIFKAIEKKKREVYLPFRWNFVVFLWHLIPKWIWERI